MLRLVLRVLDGHIPEQYEICSKDVVHPVTDLLSVPLHSPCEPILQPRINPWE